MKLSIAAILAAAILAKAEFGGILICQGVNATGPCHYEVYSMDDCHDLPDGFVQNSQTFAPDGDGHECLPYTLACADFNQCHSPHGCHRGVFQDFDSPDKFNFAWYPSWKSFRCRDASLYD